MDKEKEGVLGTIAEAAKTRMDAVIEGVSSAATSITEAVTGWHNEEVPKAEKAFDYEESHQARKGEAV
jgi:hypothetical protein